MLSACREEYEMSEPTRVDSVTTYGHWATVAGYLLAFVIVYLMFAIADGFS